MGMTFDEIKALAATLQEDNVGAVLPGLFKEMRLAGLLDVEIDLVLKAAAEASGIGLTPLRSDWLKYQKTHEPKESGVGGILTDPEPWPDPVDGAALLGRIEAALRRHVILEEPAFVACALWGPMTYAPDSFEAMALLIVTSPLLRCGKTTLLAAMSKIVNRPLPAGNVSAAAIYRVIEDFTPTLIIDECDSFLEANEEARGILNSGFTRAAACVIRCEGDDKKPKVFSTWAPKILAGIGRRAQTLMDRGIIVEMKRKLRSEKVARLRGREADFQEIRRMCRRWADDNAERLAGVDPAIPESLNDREADLWGPLFQIAAIAGGPWPERCQKAALALCNRAEGEEAPFKQQILADCRDAFDGHSILASADLLRLLNADDSKPWATYCKDKPLHARALANLLRSFKIRSRSSRPEDVEGTRKGYHKEDFVDAWKRFLPEESVSQRQPASNPEQAAQSLTTTTYNETNPAQERGVCRMETSGNSLKNHNVPDVPDKKQGDGKKDKVPTPSRKLLFDEIAFEVGS
ncbi:MAG: DUF3631 domain-containing protein [Acidobacteria bacterium]|nr:DUF3631 domain-containing protein [Acidobacteriota bacterium]